MHHGCLHEYREAPFVPENRGTSVADSRPLQRLSHPPLQDREAVAPCQTGWRRRSSAHRSHRPPDPAVFLNGS
jgi:hypothetical protein